MALRRVFAFTSLQNSKYQLHQWIVRNFYKSPLSHYSEKQNGEDQHQLSKKFESVPECKPLPCEPKIARADEKFPLIGKVARDEIGAYIICPPAQEKKKFTCADLPLEPRPAKRKRKPFVPASACKKPKPSPSAEACEKLRHDLCYKITMPNCHKARNPPKCLKEFKRPDCKRVKPPVAAYSECFKPPKKTRQDECDCIVSRKVCLN